MILLTGVGVDASDGGNIQGRGHIVDDGIQELLNALVLVRGAAGDGNQLILHAALTQSGTDHVSGNFLALENKHHDLVVQIGSSVNQLLAVFLCQIHHVLGDGLNAHILAEVIIIYVSGHLDQVDDALEIALGADGQLNGHPIALQAIVNHPQDVVEVSAHDVHLVDVNHAGNMVVISLTPYGLRLRLNTALGAQHGNAAVQHTQGTLYLDGKVNVARGVDDIDTVGCILIGRAAPETGGSSGGDGNTTLLLLCHPVHGSGAVMSLTDLVVYTSVEQNTLCGGSFAGINMRHDADISGLFQTRFLWP